MSNNSNFGIELYKDLVNLMKDVKSEPYTTGSNRPAFDPFYFRYLCSTQNLGAKFTFNRLLGVSLIFTWKGEIYNIRRFRCDALLRSVSTKIAKKFPVDGYLSLRTRGLSVVEIKSCRRFDFSVKGKHMDLLLHQIIEVANYFAFRSLITNASTKKADEKGFRYFSSVLPLSRYIVNKLREQNIFIAYQYSFRRIKDENHEETLVNNYTFSFY